MDEGTEGPHRHDWRLTGERGIYLDFQYAGASGQHRRCRINATYVRCACGQIGFMRPLSSVVYTWSTQECPTTNCHASEVAP